MASLNKVILIGHVGSDPEIRHLPSGDSVASFSLATSEKWKDKSGAQQEKTEWHRVSVFGKTADVVKDYVSKGKQLYIEGTLATEEWTDRDGNKRSTTKVKVSGFNSRLILLGGGGERKAKSAVEEEPGEPQAKSEDDLPF